MWPFQADCVLSPLCVLSLFSYVILLTHFFFFFGCSTQCIISLTIYCIRQRPCVFELDESPLERWFLSALGGLGGPVLTQQLLFSKESFCHCPSLGWAASLYCPKSQDPYLKKKKKTFLKDLLWLLFSLLWQTSLAGLSYVAVLILTPNLAAFMGWNNTFMHVLLTDFLME